MSAGWVGGSVRAAAMARRRLGSARARSLAASGGLPAAVAVLSRSPYGTRVHPDDSLARAQRGVAETLLWNLRVLAGWLPADGAEALRLLAGWFEIANVDEHLRALEGRPAEPPFALGTLATAWPRLAAAGSLGELREGLAASAWGDPGADTAGAVSLWLRLSWAVRVSAGVPPARPWAAGAAALLVARERFASGQGLPAASATAAVRLLGTGWSSGGDLVAWSARLPSAARWTLTGLRDAADLWRGESRWWARLRGDGLALLAGSGFGPRRPLGAVAVLAADAWQVRAALEVAARSSGPHALEAFDAVA